MKIIVTDIDGQRHEIAATPGWKVMEIIREAGLPIRAECGGCCACATCHVHVAPAWQARLPAPGSEEDYMLDETMERLPNSRLSCQLAFTPELDGLEVTLAPDAV